MFKRLKSVNYRHYICLGISLCFFACGFFFPYAGQRLIESFRDLGLSFAYYFLSIKSAFSRQQLELPFTPTVSEPSSVPFESIVNFPAQFEIFREKWGVFWKRFFSFENLKEYYVSSSDFFLNLYTWILVGFPVIILLYLLLQKVMGTVKTDDDHDTRILRLLERTSDLTYRPMKRFLKDFFAFLSEHKLWVKLWLFIWAFYFNVITIVVEFFAFYIYLSFSMDFANIFVQIYKLFLDLSVPMKFIPVWCWFVIVFWYLCKKSDDVGFLHLYHNENKNRGLMNERGVSNIIDGPMGSGKTLLGTDMALTEEVKMRNLAYEVILESDLKFPNFPWINLERDLKRAFENHEIFSVPSCRRYLRAKYKSYRRKECSERIYSYDIHRYPTKYNNELEIQDIWQVIDDYSCAYLVYTIQSSLLVANYSIRVDNFLMDMGNFPVWNTDFFKRDPRLMEAQSRHAHILDWDMLRIGKVMLDRNPNRFAFGFGIYVITELNQERKNMHTLKDVRSDAKECNQKNDLFEVMVKLGRHPCVIANRVFVKFIADLQRTGDISSSLLELGEVIHIAKVGEFVPVLPFWSPFWILQGLSKLYLSLFKKTYLQYRFNRSDNTALMYILKKIATRLNGFIVRKNNLYGTRVVELEIESGKLDGDKLSRKYYESTKKIFSRRYATDAHAGIFEARARYNEVGLNDLKEYLTHRSSDEELLLQHSFMQADLKKLPNYYFKESKNVKTKNKHPSG